MSILSFLTPILGSIITKNAGKVIDNFVTNAEDRETAKRELDREVKLALLEQGEAISAQAGAIVLAEAKSDSWITSSWRPLAALMFTLAIGLNLILVPVAAWFGINITYELPSEVWTTFNIMLGGYVVSRGAEKVADTVMKK